MESALHIARQFDKFPGIIQELQWRSWFSFLPSRMNFRRADTVPMSHPALANVRFTSVVVGGSFYLAIDSM